MINDVIAGMMRDENVTLSQLNAMTGIPMERLRSYFEAEYPAFQRPMTSPDLAKICNVLGYDINMIINDEGLRRNEKATIGRVEDLIRKSEQRILDVICRLKEKGQS